LTRQADLLEVIAAPRPPARLARRLHGWQQQRHEHPNNRDHHQQLHQRKAAARDWPARICTMRHRRSPEMIDAYKNRQRLLIDSGGKRMFRRRRSSKILDALPTLSK
jgi:hypothetical protein